MSKPEKICSCVAKLDRLMLDLNSGKKIGFAVVTFTPDDLKTGEWDMESFFHELDDKQVLEASRELIRRIQEIMVKTA
jgi:hypothetical protein